jgi:hypothetical protein
MYATQLLGVTHKFYSLMRRLENGYEERVKMAADRNPDTPASINNVTAVYTPSFKMPVKHSRIAKHKPYEDRRVEVKATLKKLNKLLDVKPPITHGKIVKLMGLMNVPVEKYVAQRIDVMLRKYLTDKMKRFTEETYKKNYFNSAPPFRPSNTANVTWERELKGLMKTALDSDGLIVKRPTERLTAIIAYCSPAINGAYKDLDDRDVVPGKSAEEAFVQRVAKYNGYAALVNNVSAIPRYNASSLVFTYFKRASDATFDRVASTLGDIKGLSPDVERVLLTHLLEDKVDDDTDSAVKDPYNVVSFGGFPYEQLRPALRAEYVLLKLLFYLGMAFGVDVQSTYRSMFVGGGPISADNVLQLYPGLMTIMFFLINSIKDPEGTDATVELDHRLRFLTSAKGHFGSKQEAVEIHKTVSAAAEKVTLRCIDILVTNPQARSVISPYCNLLFLRSGLLRDATAV